MTELVFINFPSLLEDRVWETRMKQNIKRSDAQNSRNEAGRQLNQLAGV